MAKAKSAAELKTSPQKRKTAKTPPKDKINKSFPNNMPPVEEKKCSFCGQPPTSTNFLIAGPPPNNLFICERCVEVCVSIFLNSPNSNWVQRLIQLMANPKKYEYNKMDNGHKGKN